VAPAGAQGGDGSRSRERGQDRPTSSIRYVFAGIGIDDYAEATWPDLANANHDLNAVRDLLTQRFGFFTTDDLVIRDGAADETGIKRLVRGTLREVLRPEDRLVLFYAGHGAVATDTVADREVVHTGHIVPHDASDRWSWIQVNDFLGWVNNLPAEQILVILDACHSGFALPANLKEREDSTIAVEDLESQPGRRVLVSAKAFQLAADGGGDFPNNSLFTGWLTEGLRLELDGEGGADRDGDGVVSTWELFHFLRERLQEGGAKQTPVFGTFSERDAGGQIVFPLGVDPADAAYERAMAALQESDQTFAAAAEAALELLPREGARSAHIRFELALRQDRPVEARDALLRLRALADAGRPIPMNPQMLRWALNGICKDVGGCDETKRGEVGDR
jgi:hypothetical protein